MVADGAGARRLLDLEDGAELLRRLERLEALIPAMASEAMRLPHQVVAEIDASKPFVASGAECRGSDSTRSRTPLSPAKNANSPQARDGGATNAETPRDIGVLVQCGDELGPARIEFPESVYSDFVVTCARGRAWPICTSSLVLFICLLAQSVFTAMVAIVAVDGVSEMTATEGKDGDQINLYAMWRESLPNTTAMGTHFTKQGLICNGLSWSWEANMAEDMLNYATYSWLSMNNLPDGRFFGYVAITLWILYVLQELRSIFSYMCVLSIGQPPKGRSAFHFDQLSGAGQLVGLTKGVMVAIVMVTMARLALCLTLGFYGIKFLAYTTNLGDFILNCVALLFIHDVDDLCFAVLLSHDKQKAVRTLEAPAVGGRLSRGLSQISPFTEVLAVVLALIAVCCCSTLVEDFSEAYIAGAYSEVCSGFSRL